MNTKIKHALTSKIFIRAVSVIIGFLFWTLLSESFTASRWVTIPIAFYNKGSERIESPEHIKVELRGRRSYLKRVDYSKLSLHIDTQTLKPGPNLIEVTADRLFLPSTISVGETIPHAIALYVTRETTEGKPL